MIDTGILLAMQFLSKSQSEYRVQCGRKIMWDAMEVKNLSSCWTSARRTLAPRLQKEFAKVLDHNRLQLVIVPQYESPSAEAYATATATRRQVAC